MESKDTLGTIATDNSASNDTVFLIIIFIIMIGTLLYMLFKPKKTDIVEKDTTSSTSPKDIKSIPSKENNGVKEEFDKPKEVTKPKPEAAATTIKKEEKKPTSEPIKEPQPKIKETEIVVPEIEEQSKEKYIGYNPINIFAQTEPLYFPYVIMPNSNCVIKFPRKGRVGRKGYKEEAFKEYIEKYFKSNYQVFDDRFILIKNSTRPFEPDFTLIDEKEGINIFIDIEIDEPYEGLNDVVNRKPTHFQFSDTDRNNAFKNRGWIIIRFAEIQVHQQPDSCCLFISDVIKSINSRYKISEALTNIKKIQKVRQWTKEEAKIWSINKYREKYLGISSFGLTAEGMTLTDINETELGDKIEEKVQDDVTFIAPKDSKITNPKLEQINSSIKLNKFLSFKYKENKTIVKPLTATETTLTAFCYIKNSERSFDIYNISDLHQKDKYFILKVAGPSIGLDQITTVVNTAINYHRHIRMKYTRRTWNNMLVDIETGELLIDRVEAEESIRTINDVQLSINALAQEHIENYRLDNNYLTAYCNKREEQRTFKFDRISEIEILDI
ncbi:hypothetical protein ACSVH2_08605 [Flavobacterium sp. RSB2_4_14]|uniref:WYL domain-containing protein n=1 Tax=Flavobacterium sp. RSB2_4_14 TaxID=3447665 RepID=UPI003F2A3290